MDDPRNDPRWQRLHDRDWTCPCCQSKHTGLFDLTSAAPDYWRVPAEGTSTPRVTDQNNFLNEDICVIDREHFFVRCVLALPILGVPEERFGFGVWSSLSKENFDLYIETFDSGSQSQFGPWFGWLSNRLKGYRDTLSLKCQVRPQDGGNRPLIELEPTEHPLAIEQQYGITFDRILELYALSGHDLRDALTD